MREILFRGKRCDNGEWVYGNYGFNDTFTAENHYIFQNKAWEFFVDPDTVGQYTGLTDKNGKRIFEGDIVEGGDFDAEEGYGVIRWEDGAFEVATETFLGTFHENYWGKDFEIIGNIHDNPELLEVER